VAWVFNLGAEKFLRNIKANTCPVTGLTIGVNRAAVPDIFQGLNRHLNNITARRAVNRGDKAYAAIGVFVFGVIGMSRDKSITVCFVFFEPIRHI